MQEWIESVSAGKRKLGMYDISRTKYADSHKLLTYTKPFAVVRCNLVEIIVLVVHERLHGVLTKRRGSGSSALRLKLMQSYPR
jgi:hypothetical protein